MSMATTQDDLPQDVESLQRLARQLQQQINNLRIRIDILEEERRLERAKRFAASSEKNALQYCLFDEAEVEAELHPDAGDNDESVIEVKPHQRRGGRKALPKDLPRATIVHDLSDAEKRCACGCQLHKIDEIRTEQVDIVPAQVTVVEHVRYKYACQACDAPPKLARIPAQPIPKSRATAGFLAYVATAKYADGIPLYRQCHAFSRLGIEQERHTLAHQMIKCGQLVQPLINLFQDYAMSYPILQMDETRIQVLKEAGREASQQSYMWVMRGGPPNESVIIYNYEPTRSQRVPEKLLCGYKGYLQTDGYAGYNAIHETPDIIGVGCWQHVRRKYTDAHKAIKSSDKKPHTQVQQALRFIGRLYALERRVKNVTPDERYAFRQKKSLPVLQEFKQWLEQRQVNPQGKLGEAIAYTLKQWPKLENYCIDGRLEIDNNLIENKIRPFAIGRKNWLFSTSTKGATASANLYSLIETAKANALNEYAYLKFVFTQLPRASTVEDFERLLPWNIDPSTLKEMRAAPVSTNS